MADGRRKKDLNRKGGYQGGFGITSFSTGLTHRRHIQSLLEIPHLPLDQPFS
jgi:hypothetical protein